MTSSDFSFAASRSPFLISPSPVQPGNFLCPVLTITDNCYWSNCNCNLTFTHLHILIGSISTQN